MANLIHKYQFIFKHFSVLQYTLVRGSWMRECKKRRHDKETIWNTIDNAWAYTMGQIIYLSLLILWIIFHKYIGIHIHLRGEGWLLRKSFLDDNNNSDANVSIRRTKRYGCRKRGGEGGGLVAPQEVKRINRPTRLNIANNKRENDVVFARSDFDYPLYEQYTLYRSMYILWFQK